MVYIMIGFVLVVATSLAVCRYVRWRDVGLLAVLALALALIFVTNDSETRDGPDNEVIIHGTGRLISREMPVKDFSQVETDLAIGLDIRQGDEYSVVFTADDALIDYLQVVQEGKALTLDLDPRFAYELLRVSMRATITAPALDAIHLGGSSRATLHGLRSLDRFEAGLTGSTALVGEVEARQATFELTGSSYLELDGSSQKLLVDSCGNNWADFSGFAAADGRIHAGCHSQVTVNVDGHLDVDASQHARVSYAGRPGSAEVAVHEYATVGTEVH